MIIAFFYAVFLVLAFFLLVVKRGYRQQDNVLNTYEAAFLIFLSSSYFIKVMREMEIPELKEFYFSWINSGVLIYFSTSFLIFLFSKYIESRGLNTFNNLYTLYWPANIAYNCLLAVGIWKARTR